MSLINPFTALLFIAASGIAVSYGWGMRGTTLGAEKGAMLPGALMGMMIAVFSGSDFLRENFFLLSAAGAMGIYFGGTMSYMQSIGMAGDRNPPEDFRRGMTGIFVKGCIWYGIFGAFIGMFLSFLSGQFYNEFWRVLLLFGVLPLFALCGSRLFDRPFDAEKGVHPKIYFSRNRPESMGVLFGILVWLVIFQAIHRDTVALAMTLGCLLTGGASWVLGQLLHLKGKWPNKKGKRLFNAFYKKGIQATLKIVECSFGMFAGIGISLTFILIVNFSGKYQTYDFSLPSLTGLDSRILPAIFVALMLVDMTQNFIQRRKTKEEYEYMLARGWISGDELALALQKTGRPASKAWLRYERAREIATFPIFSVIPLFFLFLGSGEVAKLVSFYVLWFVIVEEQAFRRYKRFKYIHLWRVLLFGAGFFVIFAQFAWGWSPDILLTMLLYGAGYEILTLAGQVAKRSPERHNKPTIKESSLYIAYGGAVTMHAYYFICIALLTGFAAWVRFV